MLQSAPSAREKAMPWVTTKAAAIIPARPQLGEGSGGPASSRISGWSLRAVMCFVVAWFLIFLGVVLFLLALGLAFTIYGIIAALLGILSFVIGVSLLTGRRQNGARSRK